MTTNAIWMTLALTVASLVAVPAVSAGENCSNTNYGVQANTYIIADCHGDSFEYYQYCHQQTGAGVGAGSGAVGVGPDSDPKSAAAASGTAGTTCHQGTEPSEPSPADLDDDAVLDLLGNLL